MTQHDWRRGTAYGVTHHRRHRTLRMRTPLPPRSEQDQIVEYIRQKNEQYALAEKRCQDCIGLLQERRVALISDAVTGKLDVCNQAS
jgi:hypothetical protein